MTEEDLMSIFSWKRPAWLLRPAVFVCAALVSTVFVTAQTFTTLYAFTGPDGAYPDTPPVADGEGNLFGTTPFGGIGINLGYGYGVVYKIDATTHQQSVLYSFTGGKDGSSPFAGLVLDGEGNLFGAIGGTMFEFVKSGNTYTRRTLYSSNISGGEPLVIDSSGNLYGIGYTPEPNCQPAPCAGVFKLTRSGDTYQGSMIHVFDVVSGGVYPQGNLAIDSSGNLYGRTASGGDTRFCIAPKISGCGTVFKLAKTGDAYTESVVYTFDHAPYYGTGGVAVDSSGSLYVTEYFDTYEFSPSGNTYTVKHFDNFGTLGSAPVIDPFSGRLYGASQGSTPLCYDIYCGSLSMLDPTTGKTTSLYSFGGGSDGMIPVGLSIDSVGNVYGATAWSGDFSCALMVEPPGCGTVFKFSLYTEFSRFTAELEIARKGFAMEGEVTPGAGAKAIDPLTQALSLVVGTYKVTIPAGSFHADEHEYVYSGVIGNVHLVVRLETERSDSWHYQVFARGVDLPGGKHQGHDDDNDDHDQPHDRVSVVLALGDNSGTVQASTRDHGHFSMDE
jgi:uncharacterized repeat protein (TIGR03803 family)